METRHFGYVLRLSTFYHIDVSWSFWWHSKTHFEGLMVLPKYRLTKNRLHSVSLHIISSHASHVEFYWPLLRQKTQVCVCVDASSASYRLCVTYSNISPNILGQPHYFQTFQVVTYFFKVALLSSCNILLSFLQGIFDTCCSFNCGQLIPRLLRAILVVPSNAIF